MKPSVNFFGILLLLITLSFNPLSSQFYGETILLDSIPKIVSCPPADIDNDGDVDFLGASYSVQGGIGNHAVIWSENSLNGSFEITHLVDYVPNVSAINMLDYDGDQDLDIIAGTYSFEDSLLYVIENLGGGSFGPKQIISSDYYGYNNLTVKDLNNDQIPDLLFSCFYGVQGYFLCNGDGSFQSPQLFNCNLQDFVHFDCGDIDGDSDLDVFIAAFEDGSTVGDTLAWFENLNNLSFGPMQVISTNIEQTSNVLLKDIDSDNDLDVICTSIGNSPFGYIYIFQNDGIGNLSPLDTITGPVGMYGLSADDYDNDGDIDLATTSSHVGNVTLYLNQGSSQWEMNSIVQDVYGKHELYSVDINQDGDIDLISASSFRGDLRWYHNQILNDDMVIGEPWVGDSAQWVYLFSNIGTGGYATVTPISDTIISDTLFQVLQIQHESFGYNMDNEIFHLNTTINHAYITKINDEIHLRINDKNYLQYNFNGQLGQSWQVAANEPDFSCDNANITIDSIGSQTINGSSLNYFTVQENLPIPSLNSSRFVTGRIYDKFGPSKGWLFPQYNSCDTNVIFEFTQYTFCEFKDGDFLFNPEQQDCLELSQYIIGIDSKVAQLEFQVLPNPATDVISILGDPVDHIKIVNTLGQQLIDQKAINNTPIDISMLSPGIYFVIVYQNQKTQDIKRLIIN